jgi:site-specific DNA recombinase
MIARQMRTKIGLPVTRHFESTRLQDQRIASDALECDPELRFVDDGYSGTILVRPGLERLRDQAAAGAIDRLYVLDPDRLSRKSAYQVLILEELTRCGVEVVFLRNPIGRGPEQDLRSRSRA